MNQFDIDALDHDLDLLGQARTSQRQPSVQMLEDGERLDGWTADLLGQLAGVSAVDWPDRAAGDRISERVAAALGAEPGRPLPGAAPLPVPALFGQLDLGVPRRAGPAPTPVPGAGQSHRTTGRARLARRPAMLVAAAAVALAAIGTATVTSLTASTAPVFRARFVARVLQRAHPGVTGPDRRRAGQWQFASYLTMPGWRAHDLSDPPDTLSCPAAAVCYVTAAHPTSNPANQDNYNILEVSRDGGASWTALALPTDISVTTPLQCPISPASCLAGGYDAGQVVLLKTDDGGLSWSARRAGPTSRNWTGYADQLACSTNLRCTGIFETPGSYQVLLTANGGRSWSAGPASPHGQQPDYLTCRGSTCALFEQLLTSDNAQSVNGDGPVTVAPGSWTAWYSHDGGAHWRLGAHPGSVWTVPSNDVPASNSISCSDPMHCMALASTSYSPDGPSAILVTVDGGANWSVRQLPADIAKRFFGLAIGCPTTRQCWAGGTSGTNRLLLATSNGGMSWSLVTLPRTRVGRAEAAQLTGLGLVSCPAASRCIAMPFAAQDTSQVPVYSLGGTS
jgi:hypothetical protein